jgi:hypothetical protein
MKTVKSLAIVMSAFLTGCVDDDRHILMQYTCSAEQWAQVKEQTLFCSEKGGFTASHCLNSAKSTLCDYIPVMMKGGKK